MAHRFKRTYIHTYIMFIVSIMCNELVIAKISSLSSRDAARSFTFSVWWLLVSSFIHCNFRQLLREINPIISKYHFGDEKGGGLMDGKRSRKKREKTRIPYRHLHHPPLGDLLSGPKMVFTPRALCNNPFVRYRVRARENTKIINFHSRL